MRRHTNIMRVPRDIRIVGGIVKVVRVYNEIMFATKGVDGRRGICPQE